MQIPIQNLYYLLCYAWNHLEERDKIKVDSDGSTDLQDLFSRVLIRGGKLLYKRGIDRDYIENSCEISGIKGKLELSHSIKTGVLKKQRTFCTIDDYSANILTNRIIISTIYRLLNTSDIARSLRQELKSLVWLLQGIDPVELNSAIFNKVRLHRNNRFYSFLMHVCELVYYSTMPSEKPGVWEFIDFTRNEAKMNKLFEEFLRNFFRHEFPIYKVKSEVLNWQFETLDVRQLAYLPRMVTDISIVTPYERIIIDAKYYSKTLAIHHDKERVHSANLYQLFSYLLNQRTNEPLTHHTRGILLYPTVEQDISLSYTYTGHTIQIRTINLNLHWKDIENMLKEIILPNNDLQ